MKGTLRLGDRLAVDGRTVEVVAIRGNSVTVQDAAGSSEVWSIGALVAAADDGHQESRLSSRRAYETSDHPALDRARKLEEHIVEATMGVPRPDAEPNPAYDPHETSQAERDQAKIIELAELGESMSLRTWQRLKRSYRMMGLAGIVDGRATARPKQRIDPIVRATTAAVLSERAEDSTRSKLWVIDQVATRLKDQVEAGEIALPSQATMYRLIDTLSAGQATFGEAPSRRSRASGPSAPFGQSQGYRPGERVEIDSTRADILILTDDGRSVRPELTAAIDTATRTICAATLDTSTISADLAMLLAEMVAPRRTHLDGEEYIERRHAIVDPALRFADLEERIAAHTEQPIIVPDTIVADLGAPYKAKHFRRACELLGISLEPARVATPTDKSTVERTIGTITRQLFQYLPGYVGRNTAHRGRNIEAVLTLEQAQDLLDEWIAVKWQRQPHDGLRSVWGGRDLTPNAMAHHFASITGQISVPMSPDDYIELLPMKWVAVHRYGVNLDRRVYDSPKLNPLRSRRNPDPISNGKWELHYNPRDLLEAWLLGPDGWIRIDWVHRHLFDQPFSYKLWEATKKAAPTASKDNLARTALRLKQSIPAAAEQAEPPNQPAETQREPVAARGVMTNFDPGTWPG